MKLPFNVLLGFVLGALVLFGAHKLDLPEGAPRATAAAAAALVFFGCAFGPGLGRKLRP